MNTLTQPTQPTSPRNTNGSNESKNYHTESPNHSSKLIHDLQATDINQILAQTVTFANLTSGCHHIRKQIVPILQAATQRHAALLSCQHILHKPAVTKLQQQLQSLHHKHAANPNLYQLLWQGLTSTLMQHELPNPHDHYTSQYVAIFEAQQDIGWLQLMQG